MPSWGLAFPGEEEGDGLQDERTTGLRQGKKRGTKKSADTRPAPTSKFICRWF